MLTKASTYDKARSLNKHEKISQLILEAKADSDSPIIKELDAWQQRVAADLTQEAIKELAVILIKNYLKPCTDPASLFMKISLPEIFNKEELKELLEKVELSEDEKSRFETLYLKNTLKPRTQFNLTANTNFFPSINIPEIQANILSNFASQDLVKLTTTSKLTQKIIAEILFERSDKIAVEFQTKTLKRWFMQLREGEPLNNLFSSDKYKSWIALLSKHLMKPETVGASKVHCALVLQYLRDNNAEKINKSLANTIIKAQTFAASNVEEFAVVLHEANREDFLNLLGFETRVKEVEIDAILDEIKANNNPKQINYMRLCIVKANLNDEQLNRAILLCFEKAWEIRRLPEHNPARITLNHLLQYAFRMNKDTQAVLVKIIEDNKQVANYSIEDSKETHAFIWLLELAKNNNPEIFALLNQLVTDRLNHPNQKSAYCWLFLLAPHLKQVDDHLISALTSNIITDHSDHILPSLTAIAKKLTTDQIAKYSYQCLTLLDKENSAELVHGAKIISALAASLSPCPQDIIQQLLSLVDKDYTALASETLLSLEPNILVLQSGFLEKSLTHGTNCAEVYQYIIKLAPLLSSQDLTENFINALIHSKQAENYKAGSDIFTLKMKALALVTEKLNDQQQDSYMASCLEHKEPSDALSCLQAIPSSRLVGKLDVLFTNCSKKLNDQSASDRAQACKLIPYFEPFSELFPDNFLTDFIQLLNDDSKVVRDSAYDAFPKILHLIKKDDLDEVVSRLFAYLDGKDSDKNDPLALANRLLGYMGTFEKVCKCFCLLTPRLSPKNIAKAKDLLLSGLNHTGEKNEENDWIMYAITKIAPSLEANELTDLIRSKFNLQNYKYVRDLVELLAEDDLALALQTSLEIIEYGNFEKDDPLPTDACLTLIKIARHTKDEQLHRKIISCLIGFLNTQTTDVAHKPQQATKTALDGLIKLVDLITAEEFETIQKLTPTSFDMIANLQALETVYDAQQQVNDVDETKKTIQPD